MNTLSEQESMTNAVSSASLIDKINRDWTFYRELDEDFPTNEMHTKFWDEKFERQRQRINLEIDTSQADLLRNFRGKMICAFDDPTRQVRGIHRLRGKYRGQYAMLRRCLEIIKENGFEDLLAKYPCSPVGAPNVFEAEGYRFTHRWIKHIYLLGLLNRVLNGRLSDRFIALDIGGGYGIFSSLLYQHFGGSRHIVVDVPEQLIFARYFLGTSFPDAQIAGPEEISRTDNLDRDFFEQYDFVLMPPSMYNKIESGAVELVTSFACLGELTHTYFDYYLQAPAFRGAQYFYTANPVNKWGLAPESDISVLDYPILERAKRLHFGISPIFVFSYGTARPRYLFSYHLGTFQPFFECITEL